MHGIGSNLRGVRIGWGLSLREVEERSCHLAEQWGNPAYRISASWLDRVERNQGSLSAMKLLVLTTAYGLSAEQMLNLCSPTKTSPEQVEQTHRPDATLLLSGSTLQDPAEFWLPAKFLSDVPPQRTSLLASERDNLPANYARGIIGYEDRMLEPMIRTGSIVLIDKQKRGIASRKEWNHEFDRPIYFLLTRSGYTVGFCELDPRSEWLTLVPHPLSHETSKRWRYRKEIEVVGTVAAMLMRRAAA